MHLRPNGISPSNAPVGRSHLVTIQEEDIISKKEVGRERNDLHVTSIRHSFSWVRILSDGQSGEEDHKAGSNASLPEIPHPMAILTGAWLAGLLADQPQWQMCVAEAYFSDGMSTRFGPRSDIYR